jgi:hypothetical protein
MLEVADVLVSLAASPLCDLAGQVTGLFPYVGRESWRARGCIAEWPGWGSPYQGPCGRYSTVVENFALNCIAL